MLFGSGELFANSDSFCVAKCLSPYVLLILVSRLPFELEPTLSNGQLTKQFMVFLF